MENMLLDTKFSLITDPTGKSYNLTTIFDCIALLPHLITDESTKAFESIKEAIALTGKSVFLDDKPITGKIFSCENLKQKNKYEYFSILRKEGKLKLYNVGQAIQLLNLSMTLEIVRDSNNKQFMVFLESPDDTLAWIGIHRGNSRNHRFWMVDDRFFKDLSRISADIGNYVIT